MEFLDIVLSLLFVYALYKGIKNGFFIEFTSFVSLLLGIYVAIKFSYLLGILIENYTSWPPKYIQIIAFGLTFLIVIICVQLLGRILTKIADFTFLGWLNTLGGAVFSILKTVLILSVFFIIFQKMNFNGIIIKQEKLNNSLLYNPIMKTSEFIYPSLEKGYNAFKEKHLQIKRN